MQVTREDALADHRATKAELFGNLRIGQYLRSANATEGVSVCMGAVSLTSQGYQAVYTL